MLKARITRTGQRDLLILGLSEGNLERLKQGRPVLVEGPELALPFDISIAYGKTEQDIAAELREAGLSIPEFEAPKPRDDARRLV